MTLEIKHQFTNSDARLGLAHIAHDPRSLDFPTATNPDPSTWVDKMIHVIDPRPNPNQTVGCCTMCAKAMQLNAVGNRVKGEVLDMNWALAGYEWETANDGFPGYWKPGDPNSQDTGSNGLASCKTAQYEGKGGEYRWILNGAPGVIQAVQDGWVVSVGTRWDYDMFHQDADGRVHPGGGEAGGHQWVVRGYWASRRWALGRCWWGPQFKDFWIADTDLDELLRGTVKGDAHIQRRLLPAAA